MSHEPISDSLLLQHLEAVAAELQIEVRYESLADEELSIHSGGCKALGRQLILIDVANPLNERARILARELSRFDLDKIYMPPGIRDFIAQSARSPREKPTPEKEKQPRHE
jgi:hypothetical protein